MSLYRMGAGGLTELQEHPFKLERDLQRLFENNLTVLTGLEFVSTEFFIQNQRLDTLAFDHDTNSFVIIEYKRSSNASVLDQGVSYLNTLLKYKADFILEYHDSTGKILSKSQIDWSQTKVVFVAPTFTDFQKQAVDFQDLNIELWEVKRFEGDVLSVNGIKKSKNAPSIKTTITSEQSELSLLTKELKTYTEEGHLLGKSDDLLELYEVVKQAIYQLVPEVELVPKKLYVAFKYAKRNIVDIELQQKQLKLFINAKWGQIDDPKKLARNVSQIGHYGNGDYELKIRDTQHLEYMMSLIKQIL